MVGRIDRARPVVARSLKRGRGVSRLAVALARSSPLVKAAVAVRRPGTSAGTKGEPSMQLTEFGSSEDRRGVFDRVQQIRQRFARGLGMCGRCQHARATRLVGGGSHELQARCAGCAGGALPSRADTDRLRSLRLEQARTRGVHRLNCPRLGQLGCPVSSRLRTDAERVRLLRWARAHV